MSKGGFWHRAVCTSKRKKNGAEEARDQVARRRIDHFDDPVGLPQEEDQEIWPVDVLDLPPEEPPPSWPEGGAEDGNGEPTDRPLISVAKRRRIVEAQAKELNDRKRKLRTSEDDAWAAFAEAVPSSHWAALPQADEFCTPPFEVHESHCAILCGGYCGCMACGSVAGFHGHARLTRPCRGHCPAGSTGPVRRLARGLYPHAQRGIHGSAWPSGEANPVVSRLLSGRRVTDIGTLRRYERRAGTCRSVES